MHSPHNQISFVAAEDIAAWLRVKINPTPATGMPHISIADADDTNCIGVMLPFAPINQSTLSCQNETVGVRLFSGGGEFNGIASKAIARGAALFAADGGKISDTGSVPLNAIALNAAGADGDIFEFIMKN